MCKSSVLAKVHCRLYIAYGNGMFVVEGTTNKPIIQAGISYTHTDTHTCTYNCQKFEIECDPHRCPRLKKKLLFAPTAPIASNLVTNPCDFLRV